MPALMVEFKFIVCELLAGALNTEKVSGDTVLLLVPDDVMLHFDVYSLRFTPYAEPASINLNEVGKPVGTTKSKFNPAASLNDAPALNG
jgi:hypothetical protein